MSDIELHIRRGGMSLTTSMIRARRCEWIGHILCKEPSDGRRIALNWLPPERRKRGQTEDHVAQNGRERNEFGWRSWAEITLAKSRPEWRSFVCALCNIGCEKDL